MFTGFSQVKISEMRCSNNNFNGDRTLSNFIRASVKITWSRTIYAGLIVCFVPLATCDSGRNRSQNQHLTYASIYNNTKYAHLQPRRPYQTLNISYIKPNYAKKLNFSYSEDSSKDNELEYDEDSFGGVRTKDSNNQLLVGFSYDPYRFSVPEDDYAKGVRSFKPDTSDMKTENRGKRGVAHLYNMIYCATGCEPLSYKGYGCYCGFLGSGRATDPIDRCCKMHDQCYENLYCPFFTVYFQPYYWKCYHNEPLCALENYSTRYQMINGCAGRLCECDRQLAMCLRRYHCPKRRALCRNVPLRLLQNVLMLR